MSTSLEDRLRAALAAEAERSPAFPTGAPETSLPHRRPFVKLGLAAGVVTAVALAVTLGPSGSSGRALAGWTSAPSPAGPSVTAALAGLCGIPHPLVADVRGHAGYLVGVPTPVTPGQPLAPDVLVGTSNPAGGVYDCLAQVPGQPADPDLRDVELSGELPTVVSTPSPEHPLVVLAAKSPEGNAVHQHNVTWVSGRVDSSITSVTVATAAGLVTATVADGRFAAWWPGNDGDIAVVRGYDRTGRLLATADQLNCDDNGRLSPRMTASDGSRTGGCQP